MCVFKRERERERRAVVAEEGFYFDLFVCVRERDQKESVREREKV